VVVADPRSPHIQRDHERADPLQVLQNPLAAGVSGQQVGEFAVDPFTHRGAQQQPPHLLALPLQHLGQQVRGHRALAPGKLLGTLLRLPG
jgi:hypothetical protein